MDSPGWQPFSVTVSTDGASGRVILKGELDLSGAPRVDQALQQAEDLPVSLVVLDLSQLTFIDSSGLEVMLRAARRAQDRGGRLVVARPSVQVRKLLEMTAIDQALDIVDDVV
ncbi:MAG: STAS domain-containing protein [Thermoleophilaceae bacterium]